VLEVTLEGNISLETPEMTVDIYETAAADPVPVQVLIVGGRGPDNWQAMFGLDLSMITTGAEVEVEVLQGPLAVGNGTVRKFPSNPEVDNYESILASAGTIRVALETSRPMVTGTVQVEPKDLSAVLRGASRYAASRQVPTRRPSRSTIRSPPHFASSLRPGSLKVDQRSTWMT